jgi:hypothetical protein
MIFKVILAIVAVLVGLGGIALVLGAITPIHHRVAVSIRLRQRAETLFDLAADVKAAVSWRDGMTSSVVVDPAPDGAQRFRQTDANGTITYRIEEAQRPNRFVTRIDDPSLPFGGTWTISFVPSDDTTDVTIVEDGVVRSSVFRFFARYIFGYYRSAESYLNQLAKHVGENGAIRRLEN